MKVPYKVAISTVLTNSDLVRTVLVYIEWKEPSMSIETIDAAKLRFISKEVLLEFGRSALDSDTIILKEETVMKTWDVQARLETFIRSYGPVKKRM